MAVSITEDIKSASELKKHMREVFEHLHKTGRPVVVTVNGRPDVVLLDAAVFENKLKTLNLSHLLAKGEADVLSGKVRPVRSFLKSLKQHAKKISG
ncbi:MAG: type II toxin-antitoxin system Phd/YefM family antitoxin [Candidatus Manganitrophus sp. SA1]|nr:type II toxin-antitoxin system Phd/YefM family antitoxin [Candidatus Manganitrophus morganii]